MKKLSKRKVKERRKVGIAKAFISRAAAIRKLQLPLSDFRRLCILKGVYPVEPKNKSKLSGSNTRRKTYFFMKDIQFLMHEPLLMKFWEFKTFMKRLTRAKGRHDLEKFQRTIDNKPMYQLDALVKERYPRFVDALRDCDDALSMCFLFAMFTKGRGRPDDLIDLSRKLTIEFMHYVIRSKSLRKVFISIKGYYYQAEVMGQMITWIVPHQFVIDRTTNVDINVMKTFTEFYITLLGFINFRLFKSINAIYPPKIVTDNLENLKKLSKNDEIQTQVKENMGPIKRKRQDIERDEEEENEDNRDLLIAALNKDIKVTESRTVVDAESSCQQPDIFEKDEDEKKGDELDAQQVFALENLFKGMKFFLNREVPRESLTFIIRSFGGQVSWDKRLFPGATLDESDESITHQIVDRDSLKQMNLKRIYIQPQWVYDCVNMAMLLPTADYVVGAALPPHLSPFVNEKKGDYVPPDKIKLMNLRKQFEAENAADQSGVGVESDLEEDTDMEAQKDLDTEPEDNPIERRRHVKTRPTTIVNSDFDNIDLFGASIKNDKKSEKSPRATEMTKNAERNRKKRERDSNKSKGRSTMKVKTGKLNVEDKEKLKKQEDAEYRKMGIMMIPKKKKRLFDRITKTQREKNTKTENLRAKRKIVDAVRVRSKKH